MSQLPIYTWPIVVLAIVLLGDAALCIKPAAFIRNCLRDVGFPEHLWWILPIIKASASLGLLVGIRVRYLAGVTTLALVAYFVVAIGLHVRSRDWGRNLFVNATGMLSVCVSVGYFCF